MISIIVPVFNAVKELPRCRESLRRQSIQEYEIILVNDGSNDDSGELCNALAQEDPRVKVIHRPNGGPGAARNSGLDLMTGNHVVFVDADDTLPDHALAVMLQAQARHQTDMVAGNFARFREGTFSDLGRIAPPRDGGDAILTREEIAAAARDYLLLPNRHLLCCYPWGKMLRAEIIVRHRLRFREDIVNCEDVAFNFDYLRHAQTLCLLDQTVYHFTVHNNCASLTLRYGQTPSQLFGFLSIFDHIRRFGESHQLDLDQALGQYCITMTIIALTRMGCSLDRHNFRPAYRYVQGLLQHPDIRASLPSYSAPPAAAAWRHS